MMRKILLRIKKCYRFTIGLIVLVAMIIGVFFLWRNHNRDRIRIGDSVFYVDIADTEVERQMGLSGRAGLCVSCGMLFIFDEPGQYAFWMKDMSFDLDVVWIRDGRVVDVRERVSHEKGKNEIFETTISFDQLAELPAGTIKRKHIVTGQSVSVIK